MSYSVKVEPRENRSLRLYVLYKRTKFYAPTEITIRPDQFENGKIVNHEDALKLNKLLSKTIREVEGKFIDALTLGLSTESIKAVISGKSENKYDHFILPVFEKTIERLDKSLSDGRVKHLWSIWEKISRYNDKLRFSHINHSWMVQFEAWLWVSGKPDKHGNATKLQQNTVNGNMKALISLLNKAAVDGFLKKDAWEGYKKPKFVQNIPVYLTKTELAAFEKAVHGCSNVKMHQAGMYFLLSCYTGYRISDCKRFDETFIHEDSIVVRATKNKEIVSIPVHKKLKPVMSWCLKNLFVISEQDAREYVKDLAKAAGITKDLKFHSGRHTFAMWLTREGFNTKEVAFYLGDSEDVAAVYARIENAPLGARLKRAFEK